MEFRSCIRAGASSCSCIGRLIRKSCGLLIPSQLSIDTFAGQAWIGVVPFTMWGIRASFLPPIPGTSAFHELNVRTYVHYDGVPGVWFFSLDAANSLAVWGARTFYSLPYFNATMEPQSEREHDRIFVSSQRWPNVLTVLRQMRRGFRQISISSQFQNLPRGKAGSELEDR